MRKQHYTCATFARQMTATAMACSLGDGESSPRLIFSSPVTPLRMPPTKTSHGKRCCARVMPIESCDHPHRHDSRCRAFARPEGDKDRQGDSWRLRACRFPGTRRSWSQAWRPVQAPHSRDWSFGDSSIVNTCALCSRCKPRPMSKER